VEHSKPLDLFVGVFINYMLAGSYLFSFNSISSCNKAFCLWSKQVFWVGRDGKSYGRGINGKKNMELLEWVDPS